MSNRAMWGDFEVDFGALLGQGGMGAVYRGRQLSLDRPVAIKVLDTSRAPTEDFEAGFLEKFLSEAKTLARIHDPHLITVFQAGKNDEKYWYAMELMDGTTVETRLSKEGMFSEAEAIRVALDVARALEAAHREGIVHRDVKPANVFILRDGIAKLGDFGISRCAGVPPSRLSQAQAIIGTPIYSSPEQGLGERCDHRSDIYSLGVVLYEMVTERPPFTGISSMETIYKHANARVEPPRTLNPALTEGIERVILHCLEKEPDDRYQTYAELISDLEAVVVGAIPVCRPKGADVDLEGVRRGRKKVGSLILVGCVLLGLVGGMLWMRGRSGVRKAPPAPLSPVIGAEPVPPAQSDVWPTVPFPRGVAPFLPGRQDTNEEFLERYEATARDLDDLRAVRSVLERHDEEIQHHDYTAALRELMETPRSAYANVFADQSIERLRVCARVAEGTPRPCDSLLVYATYGPPLEALERVEGASLVQRVDVLQAVGLRALEGDPATVRAVLDQLRAIELPQKLGWAREALEPLTYECGALDAKERGDSRELFRIFGHSRTCRRVAREVLSTFRATLAEELVSDVEFLSWGRDLADAPGGVVMCEEGHYLICTRRAQHRAWLLKPLSGRGRGFQIRARIREGSLVATLNAGHWVEWSRHGMTLSGQDGFVRRRASPDEDTVSVVPVGGVVLVMLGDDLLFAVEGPIEAGLRLGVGGIVAIESIRIPTRE